MGIPSLEIGKRALIAQRLGLDVTGNNIANVNTPGYSRRSAILEEGSPINVGGNYLGSGSLVSKLQSFRNEFIDKEIRSAGARLTGYESDIEFYQRIESVLAEPSDLGVGEMTSEFFNLFNELSLQPENQALRDHVIEHSRSLAQRFNAMATDFAAVRDDALKQLDKEVNNANKLIDEIARYNKLISNSSADPTSQSQTYIDERQQKLEELSKIMHVTTADEKNGSVNVFANGINLVTGNVASKLELRGTINPETGERTVELFRKDSNGSTTKIEPSAGKSASLLKMYNSTFDDADTSGDFSVVSELNTFVNAFAESVNSILSQGYGLDDAGATAPPGRDLFVSGSGNIIAGNIEVNSDITARNLPIADAPGEDGNAETARQVARIQNDPSFLNGATPSEFYSALISKTGVQASEADTGEKTLRLMYDQLDSQRESIQGVNLDEEAVNLIKFQKAFEAASRVINSTSELLSIVVNLGR